MMARPMFDSPYRVSLPGLRGLRGMGVAAPTVATTTYAATETALATAAAVTPPPANIILAAAAGVVKILQAIGIGQGCGPTCVQATSIVNQAEPYLQANILNYFAQPAPRSAASQAAAIQQAQAIMQGVNASCQAIPPPGGTQCIGDRQAGACTWKQTTDSVLLAIPGEPQPGECWNWVSGYIDPIVNDAYIAPIGTMTGSGTISSSSSSSTGSSSGSSSSSVYLIGAAVLLGLVILGGRN